MLRIIKTLVFISLFLSILSINSVSQSKENDFRLLISLVERTTISPNKKAVVKAKVENHSGKTIKVQEIPSLRFEFSKQESTTSYCVQSMCFAASPNYRENKKKIKNGESFEFEVDLTDLAWQDQVESSFIIDDWKNMFRVIPSGNYYLFMQVQPPADNSTKKEPRFLEIKSNKIEVKIETKK